MSAVPSAMISSATRWAVLLGIAQPTPMLAPWLEPGAPEATVASGAPGASQSGSTGVGSAIPSNTAQRIAEEIIADGTADTAYLGVSARTAGSEEVGTGAQVVQVQPGSPAADAGLTAGDVVTAVGDRPITTSTELTAAVRSHAPGEQVTLSVRRDGRTSTVDVTLDTAAG